MLTQGHLLPPLTNTVKSSLFTHAHSSPPSLAAGLHRCHANHSHYINNGWIFPDRRRISFSWIHCFMKTFMCQAVKIWREIKHRVHQEGPRVKRVTYLNRQVFSNTLCIWCVCVCVCVGTEGPILPEEIRMGFYGVSKSWTDSWKVNVYLAIFRVRENRGISPDTET